MIICYELHMSALCSFLVSYIWVHYVHLLWVPYGCIIIICCGFIPVDYDHLLRASYNCIMFISCEFHMGALWSSAVSFISVHYVHFLWVTYECIMFISCEFHIGCIMIICCELHTSGLWSSVVSFIWVHYVTFWMIHFESLQKAIKLTWIKRFSTMNSNCSRLASFLLGLKMPINDVIKWKLTDNYMDKCKSPFYRQLFSHWLTSISQSLLLPKTCLLNQYGTTLPSLSTTNLLSIRYGRKMI